MSAPHLHEQIEGLARLGYAARGVVYLVVGWFAVAAAQGHNRPTDSKGALAELFDKPFGAVLLAIVALGLAGYALWRIVGAVADVDRCGSDARGLATRGGQVAAGIIHAGLAVYAVGILAGRSAGRGDGESSMRDWTEWLMGMPLGQVLVGAVGVVIGVFALSQLVKAYKATFLRTLACPGGAERYVKPLGQAGFAARGVVFLLVGMFFVLAAWHANATESGGMVKALRWLQTQPFGPWLLGVVALGLVAFGLFSLVQAVYRRIDSEGAMRRIDAMA
ncbi:MAG TPA: DUF1206 domain-containing protein [Azospirillum sp.]|nr:DUF1206 domain-containing protein [Azospirillum sp.]